MSIQPDYLRFVEDFIVDDRRLDEYRDVTAEVFVVETRSHTPRNGRQRTIFETPVGRAVLELGGTYQALNKLISLRNYLHYTGQRYGKLDPVKTVQGKAMSQVRESAGFTPVALADEIGVSANTLLGWEFGDMVPTISELYEWAEALGIVCPPSNALVRSVEFSPQLISFLQEDPTRLSHLTPSEFERFVAERLDRMGYNVTLTGATTQRDGGIDLIAVPRDVVVGSVVIAAQVKHHQGLERTGREAVDRLLSWKDKYFGVGLLVTNTSFTKDAIWTAQRDGNRNFLRLRDFSDLKRWLKGQWSTPEDWREMPTKIELAPGVTVDLPRPKGFTF